MQTQKTYGCKKRSAPWPWLADRRSLMHIGLDRVTMGEAVSYVGTMAKEGRGAFVVTPNVDHMIKLTRDKEFARIYKDADLILADGVPLLWFAKGLGDPIPEKVSGSDLFPKVCKMAADEGLSVFLLGGNEGVAKKAAEKLKERYAALQIAGTYCPPFGFEKDEKEIDRIVGMLSEAKPDILFVGLGAPKQEKFFDSIRERVQIPVAIHVGASFDFVAGTVKRAPKWMSKVGLEWFYRLIKEPKRMFKRYLIDDVRIFPLYLRYAKAAKTKKHEQGVNGIDTRQSGSVRPKTILVDLTSLAYHLTGLERYAMNLMREVIRQDDTNKYILFFKGEVHPFFKEDVTGRNVSYRLLKKSALGKLTDSKLWVNQITLPLALYKEKADITVFPAFPCPLLYWRKTILTQIADLTCWDAPDTMPAKSRLFFRVMNRHSARVSKKIFTVSKFSAGRIHKKLHIPAKRLAVIYDGIGELFLKADLSGERQKQVREKYGLPERYFLSLSTLEPRKNIPLLIRAYRDAAGLIIKDQGSGSKKDHDSAETFDIPALVLAGRKGWKNEELDRILDEDRNVVSIQSDQRDHANITGGKTIKEKIIFTGFIDDEDLPVVYHMADTFVFPSLYEGFGLPPLEAISVGTRVVSSDAASLPEVLGQNAEFFRSGDQEGLKEILIRIMKEKAKTVSSFQIDPHYDWKRSGAALIREINKCR